MAAGAGDRSCTRGRQGVLSGRCVRGVAVEAGRRFDATDDTRTSFTIADPPSGRPPPFDETKPPADRGVRAFHARPDLRPPPVSVATRRPDAQRGLVFVAPKRGATQQGPMIVDDRGTLVWFHPLPADQQAFDFRIQSYRGAPVLTWWQGRMRIYRGVGVGRVVDASYRTYRGARRGNGEERPSVVATRRGQRTSLWVSWNGATDVASWRVHPDRRPVVTAPRRRFETAITLPGRPAAVVLEALDASGAVLGSSARVPVARAPSAASG